MKGKYQETSVIQTNSERIDYDPASGVFMRDLVPCKANHGAGYVQVWMEKKAVLGHRLAVLMVTGEWPDGEVDHIDHDRANNRWSNLRVVDPADNRRNVSKRPSITGVTGVKLTGNGKYQARIRHHHLGTFDTLKEAAMWRKIADEVLGFHPNHGT